MALKNTNCLILKNRLPLFLVMSYFFIPFQHTIPISNSFPNSSSSTVIPQPISDSIVELSPLTVSAIPPQDIIPSSLQDSLSPDPILPNISPFVTLLIQQTHTFHVLLLKIYFLPLLYLYFVGLIDVDVHHHISNNTIVRLLNLNLSFLCNKVLLQVLNMIFSLILAVIDDLLHIVSLQLLFPLMLNLLHILKLVNL